MVADQNDTWVNGTQGGIHPVLEQTYWQELRDSHLTPP